MKVIGEAKILKDDRGVYKTTLVTSGVNKETQEEEKYFLKINVGFRKGVEVKNKSKINIKDSFLTFYRIAETGEDGKEKYLSFPKIMVLDFDVIEEGIDEVQTSKRTKEAQENEDTVADVNYFSDDDLPF